MDIKLPDTIMLPNWAIIFAFVMSVVLTILKVFEYIIKAFKKATLELVLTREAFYRLLDSGESLYANVVLVSHESGCLIRKIEAKLTKRNGANKTFPLRVAQIGEKFRNIDGAINFSFYSTSPLAFIPENIPLRQVYICEQDSYAEQTRSCFMNFHTELLQIQGDSQNLFANNPNAFQEPDNPATIKVIENLRKLVEDTTSRIMDHVQIEDGKYLLEITVMYRRKGKRFAMRDKKAISTIKFTVEPGAKDFLRNALKQNLTGRISNLFTGQNNPNPAPEYTPANIFES